MVDRRLAYRMFRMPTQGISGRIYHLPAWKALELARRWPLILAERYARVRP
jgi:hypothetical protein